MSSNRLPSLNGTSEVLLENAKQDKVTIRLGGWTADLEHDHHEVTHNDADLVLREITHLGSNGVEQRVFNNGRRNRNWLRIDLSSRPDGRAARRGVATTGRFLARGFLYFLSTPFAPHTERDHEPNDDPQEFTLGVREDIYAELHINPTRALNHQNLGRAHRSPDREQFEFPEVGLFSTRDARNGVFEATLNQRDNCLLDLPQHIMASPTLWRRFRGRYIEEIDRFFDANIHDAMRTAPDLTRDPSYALTYVETYWEFSTENAQQAVEEMRPHLRGIARSLRQNQYETALPSEDVQGHNTSFIIDLATGVKLSIYAKTPLRVRFEVRHDLMNLGSSRRELPHCFRVDTPSALDGLFDIISADALGFLNTVLAALRGSNMSNTSETQATPFNLMFEVMSAVDELVAFDPPLSGNDERGFRENRRINALQRSLMQSLLATGSYRTSDNDPLVPAIRRLKARDVLSHEGQARSRTYRLAPAYDHARHILNGEASS